MLLSAFADNDAHRQARQSSMRTSLFIAVVVCEELLLTGQLVPDIDLAYLIVAFDSDVAVYLCHSCFTLCLFGESCRLKFGDRGDLVGRDAFALGFETLYSDKFFSKYDTFRIAVCM